jgi:endoglucanase
MYINILKLHWQGILLLLFATGTVVLFNRCTSESSELIINEKGYFETRGLNVLVFSNWYNENFSDSKISGIEIIHHGVRTVTNGDVRLEPTPEQWDPIPRFVERKVDSAAGIIQAFLRYDEYDFNFSIRVEAQEKGIAMSVELESPLPAELEGNAGFNLEFLPAAYFSKTYLVDDRSGVFPLYPAGPMKTGADGITVPQPMARGNTLVLAPEDPERHITVQSPGNELLLYDGRNQAQNGWFVVRSIIPSGQTGTVIEWFLSANTIPGWIRPLVIAHSQMGYHPDQVKVAVIELDPNDDPGKSCRLLSVSADGAITEVHKAAAETWGKYLRYDYLTFDFSEVRDPGIYILEYGETRTAPFRISETVYEDAWHPTLDVFFPVQMDHVLVNEAYRVWHGAAHLDDARQAPVNHAHFDLYAQGPTTDTPYEPGEHIPGLNIGGWFDAGDYDIRTQTHYSVVLSLVRTWESFRPERDETYVDQEKQYVDLHHPDGVPDILQQIEHGTLALIAQYRAVGHAIPGIIVPDLSQYTHLGDALTMTDNVVYDHRKGGLEPDDRWAFTSKSTPLDYGSIAALAAASRVLKGYNDPLVEECLETAERVWEEEHSHEPDIFRHGNTTGGGLESEELKAAIELLITTGDEKYAERIRELWPVIEERFLWFATLAVRAIPYMDEEYINKIRPLVEDYAANLERFGGQNPFGVPISTGGWAGIGWALNFGITNYILYKAFPGLIDPEYVYRGLNYIYGCHPGSDISFVSGVGTVSKKVAYGTNRADFSFIAGGVVPGVLILKPDFPENKEDWPFLWGENEYVITPAASYIYLVHAVNDLIINSGN